MVVKSKQALSDWQHIRAIGAILGGDAEQQYSSLLPKIDSLSPSELSSLFSYIDKTLTNKPISDSLISRIPGSVRDDIDYLTEAQLKKLEKYVYKKIQQVPSKQYANILATQTKIASLMEKLAKAATEAQKTAIKTQVIKQYERLSLKQYARLSDKLKEDHLTDKQREKIIEEIGRHATKISKIAKLRS